MFRKVGRCAVVHLDLLVIGIAEFHAPLFRQRERQVELPFKIVFGLVKVTGIPPLPSGGMP